ncbi:lipoprotein [Burkholderia lata]|uniref:DUF2968 domain-containing protein n=1 Tax=Burkholderia lata (strain ATCC 17760 / DSM 23089 / LMG 22485 / NCIMB 9086 / R18194 / 383) TaxID=482957 RepID=UPI001453F4B0|nr:DUF2968 domain-containing protein [Burkholderia lata]VWD63942.1 lipoprotein [Burkholderia lata]
MKSYLNRCSDVATDALPGDVSGFVDVSEAYIESVHEDVQDMLSPAIATSRVSHLVIPRGSGRTVQTAEVAEVEVLRAQAALLSFREFRAFAYSVDLLFYRAELVYYITLSQVERPWRVLRTAEFEAANAAFRHFEEQALRLAEIEVRRAQLEAQTQQLSERLAASEVQAERLRQDLEAHAAATLLVTSRQQQLRKDVVQLEAQRVMAQAQLNKTQRQIQRLTVTGNERLQYLAPRHVES